MSYKIKTRAFEIELYADTESYDCYSVLKWIRLHYDYVFVWHDKDVFEEDTENHKKGESKKPHYHVIIRWAGCPRYAKGLSKEMGVEERFFFPIHGKEDSKTSLKYRLRYLVHANELEKYQYPITAVKGSGKLKELFLLCIGAERNATKEENFRYVINYISSQRYVSTASFILFCCDNGLIDFYHTYGREVNRVIDEHNYHYAYKDYT